MASNKKRRKMKKRPRKPGAPHPDGDRRQRAAYTADQAVADKKARQDFWGLPAD